ncbi:protein-export chaperone SecB [Empedobacter brevis]|uniref:protein-export chaperone SecB n=1 Tax=Empedobacter brevis TaxID=247 RepID=UPI0023F37E60|nr:protein-export chaperone SecB [Empedobacter brevis]
MENNVSFNLDNYRFNKVNIDFESSSNDLKIDFIPSGIYNQDKSEFELNFKFIAKSKDFITPFVSVDCVAIFKFNNINSFDEIPSYFYRNSIAILFPYIRSFVSTITLQANIPPLILPTLNLTKLEVPLKQSTVEK